MVLQKITKETKGLGGGEKKKLKAEMLKAEILVEGRGGVIKTPNVQGSTLNAEHRNRKVKVEGDFFTGENNRSLAEMAEGKGNGGR